MSRHGVLTGCCRLKVLSMFRGFELPVEDATLARFRVWLRALFERPSIQGTMHFLKNPALFIKACSVIKYSSQFLGPNDRRSMICVGRCTGDFWTTPRLWTAWGFRGCGQPKSRHRCLHSLMQQAFKRPKSSLRRSLPRSNRQGRQILVDICVALVPSLVMNVNAIAGTKRRGTMRASAPMKTQLIPVN